MFEENVAVRMWVGDAGRRPRRRGEHRGGVIVPSSGNDRVLRAARTAVPSAAVVSARTLLTRLDGAVNRIDAASMAQRRAIATQP